MQSCNLLSTYQGAEALNTLEESTSNKYKVLKDHEIANLQSFCKEMIEQGCRSADFDGYFVGYSIAQIGKEFDLLRFGTDFLINIELKSKRLDKDDLSKVLKQMRRNHYYLKALDCPIRLFTYIEEDGFYAYDSTKDKMIRVTVAQVANSIMEQQVDSTADPDREFVPSQYLVSPFNSTERFAGNDYFLTSQQEDVKKRILCEFATGETSFFCISANAGTGKTLLTYDVAKTLMEDGKKVAVFHVGNLNVGQELLNEKYHWNIHPIKSLHSLLLQEEFTDHDMVFVDEAQRLRNQQLKELIEASLRMSIPVLFSYDPKQYLSRDEGKDIAEHLKGNYPQSRLSEMHLTDKIRTNQEIASFIKNLRAIGSSPRESNYQSVSVEYFDDEPMLSDYIHFLESGGWTPLSFTPSRYYEDPYDRLARFSPVKAHNVIGQEFSKVVFVMDDNFKYNEKRKLTARRGYYDGYGMMYQIVTRAVNELKIVVLQNPLLYLNLLEIKFPKEDKNEEHKDEHKKD